MCSSTENGSYILTISFILALTKEKTKDYPFEMGSTHEPLRIKTTKYKMHINEHQHTTKLQFRVSEQLFLSDRLSFLIQNAKSVI